MKVKAILATCCGLPLVACSGAGGAVGGVAGGGPAPLTYASLPLTESATFQVGNAAVVSFSRGSTTTAAHFDSLSIQYDAASKTYTLNGAGWGNVFGPAQLQAPPAGGTPGTDVYRTSDTVPNFFNVNKSGADNPNVADRYSYVTWGAWVRNQPDSTIIFGVAGYQTAASDLPRSGSATYKGSVQGILSDATGTYSLPGASTASLTANFAASSVTTTLNLAGKLNATAPVVDFGSYTGTAAISGTAAYQGALTGSTGYTGTFDGAFYGPSAAETGYTFVLNRGPGESAGGLFIGKK